MSTIGVYYLNPHRDQFDGSWLESENCVPTSLANGANASSGGGTNLTGASVRALLPRSQETDPQTPGWSIPDADHAMAKLRVGFADRSGTGWPGVVSSWAANEYVIIQGDSDQFSNATCSGKFNGPHCVGGHPASRMVGGLRQRWVDDPICKTGRWEYEYILHRYASKIAPASASERSRPRSHGPTRRSRRCRRSSTGSCGCAPTNPRPPRVGARAIRSHRRKARRSGSPASEPRTPISPRLGSGGLWRT